MVPCCYKSPVGNWKYYCDHLQEILTNATTEIKLYFVKRDFHLKFLEFNQSFEIRQFFKNMYQKGANAN